MTRRSNPSAETSESNIEEKEGTSAVRLQETWEEFKERSNEAAEAALEKITEADIPTRARQLARQAKSFYNSYRVYVLWGAGLIAASALYAALRPKPKKSWRSLLKI